MHKIFPLEIKNFEISLLYFSVLTILMVDFIYFWKLKLDKTIDKQPF
jgi:hypothetical protein